MQSDLILLKDVVLLSGLDRALAQAKERSGSWLVCHPGCWQCCVGAFAINRLDVERLRTGLRMLQQSDPLRAARVQSRAADYIDRNRPNFPGDVTTGLLGHDEEARTSFEEFANDEVCPALDPQQKTCDLYDARPMTCRVFGPPVNNGEGLGICELCYTDATPQQIAECEMIPDPEQIETSILREMGGPVHCAEETIVAYALCPQMGLHSSNQTL